MDPKYHRHFVSRRGEIINRIIDECNGVSITFPKITTNDSVVIIKGDKTNAEEAKRKIEEIVKDLVSILLLLFYIYYILYFIFYYFIILFLFSLIFVKKNKVIILVPKCN